MLRTLYQKLLRIHLSESQAQTLELLVLMLQSSVQDKKAESLSQKGI
ncbi:transposase, IS4 family [Limnospira maxima CS-328]|uniref:Transposase, IS4 family n=1 Tax=Limnospira maxima CS-328 TaxID=513049 RepID=B5VYB9_LIMMA|nr:hypothetical protein [Limnospira maxima]EDZ95821.1 transposase, IS4 family [Limnospira maxima CS-328]